MPPEGRRARAIPFISILPGICAVFRSASADVCVNRSASCVSGRCVGEPVTDHRGSILQLVFTVGMTWRSERRSGPPHTELRRRRRRLRAAAPRPRRPSCVFSGTEPGFVFAVRQLCQCATDSRSDWLQLIEGAGRSLIADARARTQKVTRLPARAALMIHPLIKHPTRLPDRCYSRECFSQLFGPASSPPAALLKEKFQQ